jgi:hypothetical protein
MLGTNRSHNIISSVTSCVFCQPQVVSRNADGLLSVAADKAFHNWVTKYNFYALGVEPLILQRGSKLLTLGHNALIRAKGYTQRRMAETSYSTTKRLLGDTVRALGWYRQFREIVLMFAISNIEPSVSHSNRDPATIQHGSRDKLGNLYCLPQSDHNYPAEPITCTPCSPYGSSALYLHH